MATPLSSVTAGVDLGSLLDLYGSSEKTRSTVSHNIGVLKCIRGGFRVAERHRITFSPRQEYWRLPERRLAVAYLADRWTGRFAPPAALRAVARRLLLHFDQARTDGVVSYRGVEYEQGGGFEKICAVLADYARRLPPIPEWQQLREVWPQLADSAGEDLSDFLLAAPAADEWERGFRRRFPWFGYLGAQSNEDVQKRQAFFFGYGNLWMTTNAYTRGGAQQFASVVQNTSTDQMLDAALQWANGINPIATTFRVLGRDDDDADPQDRSQYAPVIEVYGFLNLERAPFYNNRAETYRTWFDISGNIDAYELTAQVGKITAEWLAQNPAAVDRLVALFRELIKQPSTTRVELETVESPKIAKHATNLSEDLLDGRLFEELEATAESELMRLTERDAATLILHLLLDSKLFLEGDPVTVASGKAGQSESKTRTPIITAPEQAVDEAPSSPKLLPAALRIYGERALTYVKAGFHVLFAGAPGTGKTTLAQFVGYAWDRGLQLLPEQMPVGAAPLTTVGNSAWSPFHTIGGLMPTEDGTFTSHAGIFIDPGSTTLKAWRLRNGAVVLDEMNRADLDRCIGELYPLLSGSVERVSPAGLPGVESIEASPRFRVLATINDAQLDDVVFPISEGLARRFQRIELPSASRDDLLAYLGIDEPESRQDPRRAAAHEAVGAFFEVARVLNLLLKAEDDDRLPFGVAYFELLRAWTDGLLDAPLGDGTVSEQARALLAGSLCTLGRTKKWNEALRTFLAKG
jgi:hypothetical protein